MSIDVKDPQQYNFIRATIKIANPTWTPEQIEAETQRRIEELNNPEGGECLTCSS